jgi:hypothetical protein
MHEQELDSLFHRPFRVDDAVREDALLRRCASLAVALWGKTSEDLQRQLLARHPEIPPGFDLRDFKELEKRVQVISALLTNPRSPLLSEVKQSSTLWEERREVVRRAIAFLENR